MKMNGRAARLAAAVACTLIALSAAAPAQAAVPKWAGHFYSDVRIAGGFYTLDREALGETFVSLKGPCSGGSVDTATKFVFKLYRGRYGATGMNLHPTGPLVGTLGRAGMMSGQYASWWITSGGSHARYASITALARRLEQLEDAPLEVQREYVGLNCARDERREETRYAVTRYVRNIQYYARWSPTSTTDLSTRDFAVDEITTEHRIRPLFDVMGTPASGFVASVTDRVDNYRWSYSSATGEYTETKL